MQALRQEIYEMIEALPDSHLGEVVRYIERLNIRIESEELHQLSIAKAAQKAGDMGITSDEAIAELRQIIQEARDGEK
jgi:hypothetical protein